MVTTDKLTLDVDLVVGRTADDDATERESQHVDKLVVRPNFDARYVRIVVAPALPLNLPELLVDARVALVLLPVQFLGRGNDIDRFDDLFLVRKSAQQRSIAQGIDESRHAA